MTAMGLKLQFWGKEELFYVNNKGAGQLGIHQGKILSPCFYMSKNQTFSLLAQMSMNYDCNNIKEKMTVLVTV